MKRLIDNHLQKWKKDPSRKALLLRGARQVGKTYSCRKLGHSFEKYVERNYLLFLENTWQLAVCRKLSWNG